MMKIKKNGWIGTEKQVFTRLYIVCNSRLELADVITEYRQKIRVISDDNKEMLLKGFSLTKMMN